MTSPTSSTQLFAPIPRKKRPLSTSTNSSPSTHSSIYDAAPCSSGSPSPTPSLRKPSYLTLYHAPSYTQYLDSSHQPSPSQNNLPTIREQKSAAAFTSKDSDVASSYSSTPLLGDPYASSIDEDDSTYDFIDSLERYYGSPTAPLLPGKEPPPPLPPIPDNVTTISNGRVMSVNARPWRPGPSGHRSYGTLGGHPFHHAPVAEVGGTSEVRVEEEEEGGAGCWKAFTAFLCCFGCLRNMFVDDDDD